MVVHVVWWFMLSGGSHSELELVPYVSLWTGRSPVVLSVSRSPSFLGLSTMSFCMLRMCVCVCVFVCLCVCVFVCVCEQSHL